MNNRERLRKIIKALNELKEILSKKKHNAFKLKKARGAVKSAISPLEETYDLLSKTIGSNCSYVTRTCLENIRLTIRDYKGTNYATWGYPGLWDSLAKSKFISELEAIVESIDTEPFEIEVALNLFNEGSSKQLLEDLEAWPSGVNHNEKLYGKKQPGTLKERLRDNKGDSCKKLAENIHRKRERIYVDKKITLKFKK